MTAPTELLEALASDIAEVVYLDIAKWHLYLNDAKLHVSVAEQLYPLVESGDLTPAAIAAVLDSISISIGGDRGSLSLLQVIPRQCERELLRVLEEFQERL